MTRAQNITVLTENDGWMRAANKINANFRQVLLLIQDASRGEDMNSDILRELTDYDGAFAMLSGPLFDMVYPIGSVVVTMRTDDPRIGRGTWRLVDGGSYVRTTAGSPGETGGSSKASIDSVVRHKHRIGLQLSPNGNGDVGLQTTPEGVTLDLSYPGYEIVDTYTDEAGASSQEIEIMPEYITVRMYVRTA